MQTNASPMGMWEQRCFQKCIYRLERGNFSGASLRSPVRLEIDPIYKSGAQQKSELSLDQKNFLAAIVNTQATQSIVYLQDCHGTHQTKKNTHTHTHTRIITPSLASLHTRTRTTIGTTNEQLCPRPHSCFLLPGRPTAARHSPSWLRALLATSTLRRSANASLAMRSRSPVDKSISDCVAAQIKEKHTRGETSEITERWNVDFEGERPWK